MGRDSKHFSVEIGVHKGSVPSTFLFSMESGDVDNDITHRVVRVLANQELSCSEYACCANEDVEMDVWVTGYTRSDKIRNGVIRIR
ncbi:hypothetical protein H5410_050230 [Solanum commersonii]|uniref:Uncharacterized protein n=1 Tax=Solanum commersonii TaxID=4109 RepID=A0A9J5WUU0_SOLCO|nr:hypothetical protein H5410_050230 [Solanum commersonii]